MLKHVLGEQQFGGGDPGGVCSWICANEHAVVPARAHLVRLDHGRDDVDSGVRVTLAEGQPLVRQPNPYGAGRDTQEAGTVAPSQM